MQRRTLFVALGIVLPGAVLGAVLPGAVVSEDVPWPTSKIALNSTLTDLVITSHNPTCTALFLNSLGATRLTDVRPYYHDGIFGYDKTEYKSGIEITVVIPTSDTNRTVSAILERPDISIVTAYPSVPPNSTNQERSAPLKTYTNPNAVIVSPGEYDAPFTPCNVIHTFDAEVIMDQLGWAGSPYPSMPTLVDAMIQATTRDSDIQNYTAQNYTKVDLDPWPLVSDLHVADDGIEYYGDLMAALIRTDNTTATWAYLKKNGAVIYYFISGNNPLEGSLETYIQPSLVWSLLERDEVNEVIEKNYNDFRLNHYYGDTYTQGLSVHPNVENWHRWGYNGTGAKVGIIDIGFAL